ncbi:hypothetical protein BCON_0132g00110 [Botryotinia convoluta]|uniref:Uncharacterized protein n=1 Tax=Botryotinia convoluta TaxID=54673 RepID=A0A4Z1HVZ2_9HELO|nr:hypothetical protein BCON_0132g00110 [Botryotinia convoluta]
MLRAKVYDNPFALSSEHSKRNKSSFQKYLPINRRTGLLDIPTNVLEKILRELLVPQTHIMPVIIREKGGWAEPPILHYRYQWSEARQEEYELHRLPQHMEHKPVQIFWAATPTKQEARLIEAGYNQLTTITKTGRKIQGFLHDRKGYGVQVIHRSRITLTAISGVAILRSCKCLNKLGVAVLYGENSFLFDTRGSPSFTGPQSVVTMDQLSHDFDEIPGHRRKDGTMPTAEQISHSIDMIFQQDQGKLKFAYKDLERNEQKSKFIYQDPFTRFLMEIGRNNASRLTKIVIQGKFNWIIGKWQYTKSIPVELHDLLPIYTIILKEVCENIHTLILHDDDRGYPQMNRLGPRGTDRNQQINESVEKLVHALPYLQKLQLGQYEFVPAGCGYDPGTPGSDTIKLVHPDDEWGMALKWMGFVEQRAQSRALAESECEERKEDGEKPRS